MGVPHKKTRREQPGEGNGLTGRVQGGGGERAQKLKPKRAKKPNNHLGKVALFSLATEEGVLQDKGRGGFARVQRKKLPHKKRKRGLVGKGVFGDKSPGVGGTSCGLLIM